MRINWFSPLPPAKTEIANYSANLLPALSESCEIALWTDQSTSGLSLDVPVSVRQFAPDRPPWRELNQADMNVYHIGNNPQWHAAIWRLSRQYPGLVVLHETRLAHLFLGMSREIDERIGFLEQVAAHYGGSGLQAVFRFWDGTTTIESLSEQLPLTELATTNALGVLVHNRDAFECLQPTSCVPVMCAPLPHVCSVRCPEPVTHLRKYAGAARYRLVLFGHIGTNRRLEAVLRALGGFPERHRFQLDVYGDVYQRDAIVRLIRELSLKSLVRMHGFVSESTLTAALQQAHLAINLRFPTMGEASASQLRIWDHALPSLVTPHGWYARLPADTVSFVRPEHESADLHALLATFLRDPIRFAERGLKGRKVLERCHRAPTYAQGLAAFASACARSRSRVALRNVARRAAVRLVNVAGPRGAEIGFDSLASQVLALKDQQPLTFEPSDSLTFTAPPRNAA